MFELPQVPDLISQSPLQMLNPLNLFFKQTIGSLVNPNDPRVKQIAEQTHNAEGAYNWVKTNIRYEKEEVEHFQKPSETLDRGIGDCEDATILYNSITKAQGYKTRARIVAWSPGTGGDPAFNMHIFSLVYLDEVQNWVIFDASDSMSTPGQARVEGSVTIAEFDT